MIKIYGERNTGTNYLAALVSLNFGSVSLLPGAVPRPVGRLGRRLRTAGQRLGSRSIERLDERSKDAWFRWTEGRNLGWKHAKVGGDLPGRHRRARHTRFITLTKNPYAWLRSLHRRPYHGTRIDDFQAFLDAPWPTVAREHGPEVYESPIALWNDKNRGYLELAEQQEVHLLRYEDLVVDPAAALRAVADRFGLAFPNEFRNLERSTKGERDRNFDYYRSYYLEARWKEELDAGGVERINRSLDADLLERLGYEHLSPSDLPRANP